MRAMQKINDPGIRYETFLAADGKTFMHLAIFQTDEAEQVLLALPQFKYFQEQLKQSGPEIPPQSEHLTFVGSSVPSDS